MDEAGGCVARLAPVVHRPEAFVTVASADDWEIDRKLVKDLVRVRLAERLRSQRPLAAPLRLKPAAELFARTLSQFLACVRRDHGVGTGAALTPLKALPES